MVDDHAVMAAVASLRPGAAWTFSYGKGLAGLNWLDQRVTRPTDAEILAEVERQAAQPIMQPALVSPSLAGQKLNQHLSSAIAEFSPPALERPKMRGMQRLAFLTQDLVKNMDAEADKVADEIQGAHDRAQAAIGKFREHGAQINKVADDIEAALGQLTNDPTQVSDASPASSTAGTASG